MSEQGDESREYWNTVYYNGPVDTGIDPATGQLWASNLAVTMVLDCDTTECHFNQKGRCTRAGVCIRDGSCACYMERIQ